MPLVRLKFQSPSKGAKKTLASEDFAQTFLRVLAKKWGENIPVKVIRAGGGNIVAATESAPWRAELYLASEEIIKQMRQELNCEECVKKITVFYD